MEAGAVARDQAEETSAKANIVKATAKLIQHPEFPVISEVCSLAKATHAVKVALGKFDALGEDAEVRYQRDSKFALVTECVSNLATMKASKVAATLALEKLPEAEEGNPGPSLKTLNIEVSNLDESQIVDAFKMICFKACELITDTQRAVAAQLGDYLKTSWHDQTNAGDDLNSVLATFSETVGKVKVKTLNANVESLFEAGVAGKIYA